MFWPFPLACRQRSFTTRATIPLALSFIILSPCPSLEAKDSATSEGAIQDFAQELASLRADVERLSTELESQKAELNGELHNLATQKADGEVSLRREEARLRQLLQATQSVQQQSRLRSEGSENLVPALNLAISELKTTVNSGLPYRVKERSDALDTLQSQLNEGLLTPPEVSSRLWQLAEDELRLTRENIVDRQVINLDGSDRLVEIARLGMVSLYFKSDDGQVGRAVKDASGWHYVPYDGRTETQQIEQLFDALRKQIRAGWFEIPTALTEVQP